MAHTVVRMMRRFDSCDAYAVVGAVVIAGFRIEGPDRAPRPGRGCAGRPVVPAGGGARRTAPKESGEHVGRGFDVGVRREVGPEQQGLVPPLAPLGVERGADRAGVGIAEHRFSVHEPQEVGVADKARELSTGLFDDELSHRRRSRQRRRGLARRARGTPRGPARPWRRSGSRARAPSPRRRRRARACSPRRCPARRTDAARSRPFGREWRPRCRGEHPSTRELT